MGVRFVHTSAWAAVRPRFFFSFFFSYQLQAACGIIMTTRLHTYISYINVMFVRRSVIDSVSVKCPRCQKYSHESRLVEPVSSAAQMFINFVVFINRT